MPMCLILTLFMYVIKRTNKQKGIPLLEIVYLVEKSSRKGTTDKVCVQLIS